MRLKHLVLGAALAGLVGASALVTRAAGAGQHLRAAADLPHRPVRRLRHSDRQRHERLPRRCSTSATAASAASRSPSRNARPATTPRRASNATSRSRRKKPVVVNPYSTGITLQLIPKAAVDKIPVLSMAYGLSASAVGNELPVDLQSAGDLLGRAVDDLQVHRRQGRRPRQAQGQDHRLHLLRRRLRPRADPAARAVRQGLRLRREALSGAGRRNAEPVGAYGSTCAATVRTG